MSKRLPYFQFEPAQYITKDIQFCSLASQGLFINICAIYWQRDCDLTIEQLKRRFNEQDLIDELIKEKIISIDKDAIVISFLDSQYEAACGTKISRSKAGKKSAQLKKIRKEIEERLTFIASETGKDLAILIDEYQLNSTSVDFLLQQNSTIKIIEDNIKENKEDEIKKDEVFTFKNALLELGVDKKIVDDYLKVRKTKNAVNSETAFNAITSEIALTNKTANEIITICVERSWSGFKAEWIKEDISKQDTRPYLKGGSIPMTSF